VVKGEVGFLRLRRPGYHESLRTETLFALKKRSAEGVEPASTVRE